MNYCRIHTVPLAYVVHNLRGFFLLTEYTVSNSLVYALLLRVLVLVDRVFTAIACG